MLTIETHKLTAAVPLAAVKDIRYYLNGVHLEVTASGHVHIVSTNGHGLFAGKIEDPIWTGEPVPGGFTITIPLDAIKTAAKAKTKYLTLTDLGNGRYSLGDVMFTPIEGRYPDWRRVAKLMGDETSVSQFNPVYLVECNKALRIWCNGKATFNAYVHHRGDHAGAITGHDETAFCILMPISEHTVSRSTPFTPDPI